MDESNARTAHPEKGWRKVLRRIRIGVGLTLLVLYLLSAGVRLVLNQAIEERLAVVRQAGFPTTLDEYIAHYPSASQDAHGAALYRRAFEALPPTDPQLPYSDASRISPPMRAYTVAYAQSARASLDLFHEVAQLADARIPAPLPNDELANTSLATSLSRARAALWAEAALRADDGDVAAAVDTLLTALALASAARDCPRVDGQFYRYTLLSGTAPMLCRILNNGALTPDQIAALATALRGQDPKEALPMVASAELCTFNDLYGSGEHPDFDIWFLLYNTFGHERGNFIRELPLVCPIGYACSWLAWKFGGWGQIEQIATVEECLANLVDGVPAVQAAIPSPDLLSTHLRPSWWVALLERSTPTLYWPASARGGLAQGAERTTLKMNHALALLAVERYRLEHGCLPERMEDVPALEGQASLWNAEWGPLYARLPAGYVVYEAVPDLAASVSRAANGAISMDSLQATLARAVPAVQSPYYLGGISYGALTAMQSEAYVRGTLLVVQR